MTRKNARADGTGPLILLGGGGHAKVLADTASEAGIPVLGFADDEESSSIKGLDRLGGVDEVLEDASLASHPLVLAMGPSVARSRLVLRIAGRPSVAVVHPRAVVSRSATIEPGVFVGPGAIVNAEAIVGAHAIVNSGAVVEHECVVGIGAHVCPRASMGGRSRLGERSTLGTGAVLLPGVRIAAEAVAGAMSLVNHDVRAGETVVGVPARALARGA